MIYVKVYHTDNGYIIAMCDEELLGKNLSQGKVELNLEKYRDFYKGALLSEEDAKKEVDKYRVYTANVVGKRAVAIAVELGMADNGNMKTVAGVPFLQVYNMG